MSTATVPLTEGHKMATRHFGFALSNNFGPLKIFSGQEALSVGAAVDLLWQDAAAVELKET